jgi:hypothetical protein
MLLCQVLEQRVVRRGDSKLSRRLHRVVATVAVRHDRLQTTNHHVFSLHSRPRTNRCMGTQVHTDAVASSCDGAHCNSHSSSSSESSERRLRSLPASLWTAGSCAHAAACDITSRGGAHDARTARDRACQHHDTEPGTPQ